MLFGAYLVIASSITQIQPVGNITTSNSSVEIEYNYTCEEAWCDLTYAWNIGGSNPINLTLDDSLILAYNFNNFSSLGENDTHVYDISGNGNNGTVVGGSNITWTPNGKYGGAFNFSGNQSKIGFTSIKITDNGTVAFWAKALSNSGEKNILGSNTFVSRITHVGTTLTIESDTNGVLLSDTANVFSIGEWTHVLISKSGNRTSIYKNGLLIETDEISTNQNLTLNAISPIGDSREFNGSIDNLLILNKSLSSLEAEQIYYSSLTKYNQTDWNKYSNQTLNTGLNSTNPTDSFSNYLCVNNGTEVCSSTQTITQTIPNKNLVANFTNSVGNIRNDFYGVVTHGNYLHNYTEYIDIDGDGIRTNESNMTWHREKFEDSGMKVISMDLDLYSNFNEDFSYGNSYNVNRMKGTLKYANDNGFKVYIVLLNTPTWLANTTSGWCNNTGTLNKTCTPTNYDTWKSLVNYSLFNITEGHLYDSSILAIRFWNEPNEQQYWLSNLSVTNPLRSTEYNYYYNRTKEAVKGYNSSIPFGGTSTHIFGVANEIIWQNWMSNFTDEDFFDFHTNGISSGYTHKNIDTTLYPVIFGNISYYNASYNWIIHSEYKSKNITFATTNSTNINLWESEEAILVLNTLNSYSENMSLIYYQWSDRFKYENTVYFPEFPYFFNMVSEPDLDNAIYPPYNVTKSFAHLCQAGGEVYTSSTDDSTLKVVSCNKSTQYGIIAINTDTSSKNITLNLSGNYPYPTITNYETGAVYTITNGIVDLGADSIMDSYQEGGQNNILYLTSGVAPTITSLSPTNNTYTNNATVNFSANLTDDVGLNNATLYIQNATDGSLITTIINYVAGEKSVIQSWGLFNLLDGIYHWWINLGDDEFEQTISDNYTLTVDTTAPTLSNFQFVAINSSGLQVGSNATAFNFSNLQAIEKMNISFELDDINNITGDIKLFFTANGTNACSLGNNQSSTCYNLDSGTWVEFANGTDTASYRGVGGASGDAITCEYNGNATHRYYNCTIDEHYNPNVWKHYPLNFSNATWQSSATTRIRTGIIWKVETDFSNIPLDADYYKLDFRVNASIGLTPTAPIIAFACNSSYTTGDPATSNNCLLIASKLPEELQDDGTKFRQIFTKDEANGILSTLNNVNYFLITSNTPASAYYSMKTYQYLGNNSVRSSISTNRGLSYSNLSGGYETELNINWFYNSSSNSTQFLVKVFANDSVNNSANSSIQTLTWNQADLNLKPIVDIITPLENATINGTVNVNWTAVDPNGNSFVINVSATNGTYTDTLGTNLPSSNNSLTWNTVLIYPGAWNLTVRACENNTADFLCGNDTINLAIVDTTLPIVTALSPGNLTEDSDGIANFVYNVSDVGQIASCGLYLDSILSSNSTSITNGASNSFLVQLNDTQIKNDLKWFISCIDLTGNVGNSSIYTLDTLLGSGVSHNTGGSGGSGGSSGGTTTNITLEVNNSKLLCDLTYDSAVQGILDPLERDQIQIDYFTDTKEIVSSDAVNYYFSNWQNLCSDITLKTLKPELVCAKIFEGYTNIINSGGNFSLNDLNAVRNSLKSEIDVSEGLMIYLYNNYNDVCYQEGYSNKITGLSIISKDTTPEKRSYIGLIIAGIIFILAFIVIKNTKK